MRLPYTLPSRAMLAVVSVFRTSLVAVPAFSRVDPVRTSGPGAGEIMTSTALRPRRGDASRALDARGDGSRLELHVTSTVLAPTPRAAASALFTNGVTPLADTPTTTSPAPARARIARAPARASSSAPSRER